jgi:hypothetical protein
VKSHPPHRAWALLAALALLTACGATRAERSRLGDEADVVERGDCEVGTAFERRRARGEASQQLSSLQLVCGLGWRTELTINFARQRGDGDRNEAVGLEARRCKRPDLAQPRPFMRPGIPGRWIRLRPAASESSRDRWKRAGDQG